jgi:hypothetical protein
LNHETVGLSANVEPTLSTNDKRTFSMALDQKRLQKKKAKRAKKAKNRSKGNSPAGMFRHWAAQGYAVQSVLNAPIYECWEPENLFSKDHDVGIGNVVVSRKTADGQIGVAVFLVDAYCLGVKDAFFRIESETTYRELMEGMEKRGKVNAIHPACARKLVESAVIWSESIGFSPHKDYSGAKKIFGDIDAAACPREFEFGKDGKPFYLSGPHDSPAFIRKVRNTLERRVGPGNYKFLTLMGPEPFSEFDE